MSAMSILMPGFALLFTSMSAMSMAMPRLSPFLSSAFPSVFVLPMPVPRSSDPSFILTMFGMFMAVLGWLAASSVSSIAMPVFRLSAPPFVFGVSISRLGLSPLPFPTKFVLQTPMLVLERSKLG